MACVCVREVGVKSWQRLTCWIRGLELEADGGVLEAGVSGSADVSSAANGDTEKVASGEEYKTDF